MKGIDSERASDAVFHDQALLMALEGALAGRQVWPHTTSNREDMVRACRQLADDLVKARLP